MSMLLGGKLPEEEDKFDSHQNSSLNYQPSMGKMAHLD